MTKTLPKIGLGSSGLGIDFVNPDTEDNPQECVETVATAIDLGYRHVDTAQMYENERLIGEGIRRSSVPREEVFLADKVKPSNLTYESVIQSTRASLEKLGTDSIDLLYIHWPTGPYEPEETLNAFDHLRDEGLIDHVGVSNFTVETLETARDVLDAPIAANQIQVHPMLPPTEGERAELIPYAKQHGIDLVAWSPLVRGRGLAIPEVNEVATKHDASPAQIILAWLMEYDIKVLVKSTNEAHLRDNLESLTLELDREDITLIESISERKRLFDREDAPWNQ